MSSIGSMRAFGTHKVLPGMGCRRGAIGKVKFHRRQIGDVDVFYREAGSPDRPTILLLHGYPSSSHMFRDLIPLLADRYHLIAPDLPGFGQTVAPPRGAFDYTFDNLAKTVGALVKALGI